MSSNPPNGSGGWYDALRYVGVGLTLVASVAGGVVLGTWLDRRFDTAPWLAIAGVVIGAAAGFRELMRLVRAWQRDDGNG